MYECHSPMVRLCGLIIWLSQLAWVGLALHPQQAGSCEAVLGRPASPACSRLGICRTLGRSDRGQVVVTVEATAEEEVVFLLQTSMSWHAYAMASMTNSSELYAFAQAKTFRAHADNVWPVIWPFCWLILVFVILMAGLWHLTRAGVVKENFRGVDAGDERRASLDSLTYNWPKDLPARNASSAELLRRGLSPHSGESLAAQHGEARRSSWGSSSSMSSPQSSPGQCAIRLPSAPRLNLPSSLMSFGEDGETYAFGGVIEPHRQANERIIITRLRTNKVVARIHIAEDDKGSGMMVELESRTQRAQARDPQVLPFAFLDTASAVCAAGVKMQKERKVTIFGATEDGVEATANPSAMMKADAQWTSSSGRNQYGRCVLIIKGEIILTVARDHKGKDRISHVEGKDSQLVAKIQWPCVNGQCQPGPGNSPPLIVHCAPHIDAGLVLCAIVAAIKLL